MKKKGFTLIELLAVIIILAVIALIATPIILNIIDNARKSAAEASVRGYADAIKLARYDYMFAHDGAEPTSISDLGNLKNYYDGATVTCTTTSLDKGVVTLAGCTVSNYSGSKFNYKDGKVTANEEDDGIEEANNYKEDILNGADPVLKDGLIPVTISSNGTIKKADLKEKWYSYSDKQWANAVVLKTGARVSENGTISEEDIQQYYVWVPRYRYQLWNVDSEELYPNGTEGPSAINIIFENKNTTVSNGTENGQWLTHPAFTSFDTNGIWVGKFEISYDEETFIDSTKFSTTNINYEAATNSNNIIIKPNVRSLTNKSVSEFYNLVINMNKNYNSHMIKNSEWGAIAYLTYSVYGKCTTTGCEELIFNNVNNGYGSGTPSFDEQFSMSGITGCSANPTDLRTVYQTSCISGYGWNEANNKASTTGNITGIYDMSGGIAEYVMGVLADTNKDPMSGATESLNSGFNGTYSNIRPLTKKTDGISFPTDTRYYDLYIGNTESLDNYYWDYTSAHLGDATKEVAKNNENKPSGGDPKGLWFNDYAVFIESNPENQWSGPWFVRGGTMGQPANSGIFNFHRMRGMAGLDATTRVVLAF